MGDNNLNNNDDNNKDKNKNAGDNNIDDSQKRLVENDKDKDYIDVNDDKKKDKNIVNKIKNLPWKEIRKKSKEGVKKLPWKEVGNYVWDKKNKKPRIINIRRLLKFLKFLLKLLLILAIIFGLIYGFGAYNEKKEHDKIVEAFNKQIPVDPDYNFVEEYKEALSEASDIEGMTFKDKYDMGLTLAIDSDTDGDDLTDKEEIEIYKTNPLLFSTSGDMYGDGYKVKYGMDLTKKHDGEVIFINEIPLNIAYLMTKL